MDLILCKSKKEWKRKKAKKKEILNEQAMEILHLNEQRSKERMTGGPPSEGQRTEKEPASQKLLKGGEGVELWDDSWEQVLLARPIAFVPF